MNGRVFPPQPTILPINHDQKSWFNPKLIINPYITVLRMNGSRIMCSALHVQQGGIWDSAPATVFRKRYGGTASSGADGHYKQT